MVSAVKKPVKGESGFDANSNKVINVANPTLGTDAVNMKSARGKAPCRVKVPTLFSPGVRTFSAGTITVAAIDRTATFSGDLFSSSTSPNVLGLNSGDAVILDPISGTFIINGVTIAPGSSTVLYIVRQGNNSFGLNTTASGAVAGTVQAITSNTAAGIVIKLPAILDSVTLAVNDRVLVADQEWEGSSSENGIYKVTSIALNNWTLVRTDDAATCAEIAGSIVGVTEGLTCARTFWILTCATTGTINTTGITCEPVVTDSTEKLNYWGNETDNAPKKTFNHTWNNVNRTFTTLLFNVSASFYNAASRILDIKVGGVSKFSVDATGHIETASGTVVTNLNADKVDGLHVATSGSALPAMNAANAWTGVQNFINGFLAGADASRGTSIGSNGVILNRYDDNALTTNHILSNLDTTASTNNGVSTWWQFCNNVTQSPIWAGYWGVIKEELWGSDTGTHNSAIVAAISRAGALYEGFRINSQGQLKLNGVNGAIAPIVIPSTATGVVTYLNTDLLDGQHGSYYLDAANSTGPLFFGSAPSATSGVAQTVSSVPDSTTKTIEFTVQAVAGANTHTMKGILAGNGTSAPSLVLYCEAIVGSSLITVDASSAGTPVYHKVEVTPSANCDISWSVTLLRV